MCQYVMKIEHNLFSQQVQVSNTGTMYTIPAAQQQYIRGQVPGMVLSSPGMAGNGQQIAEDASRKREMRLLKNRYDSREDCNIILY